MYMVYNFCSKKCSPKNKDPRYKKVIEQVRKNNSLVINNFSVAGEGISGLFSCVTLVTFLRLHIENDTYHPHLFHYSVGVSVGSVLIMIVLNTRFLYEEHSKKLALDYLDAIYKFLDFDNARKLFFNIGDGQTFGDPINPMILLKNLYKDGSFCVRDALVNLLEGNHKDLEFDNKPQYFTTEPFYKWLKSNRNLDNTFLVCYSGKQTKMVVFTGNRNRYLEGINFIEYDFLRPSNLINAILCSSAIPLVYPLEKIAGRDFTIDGAAAEVNQFVHLQILMNCSYYMSSNLLYTPELLFFGIEPKENNNFLIIVNKINIQYKYEELVEFREAIFNTITSLYSLASIAERTVYNAKVNVPLTSLFLTQPFISKFSINNLNHINGPAYEHKKKLLVQNLNRLDGIDISSRIPSILFTKNQFNNNQFAVNKYYKTYKEYKNAYMKYNPIVSNMVTSSYLYELGTPETIDLLDSNYKEQLDCHGKNIKLNLNICVFDVFVRSTIEQIYDLKIYWNLLIKNDTGFFKNNLDLAVVSGNMLYDINCIQSVHTCNTEQVTCENNKKVVQSINDVVNLGIKEFLGPNQS